MPKNNSQPLMIVHDLENYPKGKCFSEWPLHITVVFYFNLEGNDENEIIEHISKIAQDIGPIYIKAGDTAMFGPNNDIPVTKLHDDGKLILLHNHLISELTKLGCHFTDLTYIDDYIPHISHIETQKGPASYTINSLSIVKKLSENIKQNKKVIAKINL